jgi:hypothetical protein
VRYLALLGIPVAMGLLQREWIRRGRRQEKREVMIWSKPSAELVIRSSVGQRTFAGADCSILLSPGADGGADEILVRAGGRLLARWPMFDLEHVWSDGDLIRNALAWYVHGTATTPTSRRPKG